ncbi:carbon-nitrogen hydrolase family protein [Streptomyces sp. XY431]|uniref:carbon-nitrogen hydrolase family protein n=1 Tax=Streptomyces sp. XY431 TaxID=1415562 RepID=UPI0018FED391|nr:carbon-nitrogen hydrolase family protein [Streptomyces sp. XY431]
MPAPAPLTVAVAQPACAEPGRPDTVAVNVERHAAAVREAGAARLVVFPELSLTGYDLAAPSVDPSDERLAPLVAACAATGATALVGAPVTDPDGRDFIATIAVTGEGAAVACRKTNLYGNEPERFAAAERPALLELDGWRLGLAICADAADPGHAERLVGLGAEAYVASTLYGAGPEALATKAARYPARAADNGVWVVLATAAGPSGEFAASSGGSGVWAPDGSEVAKAGTGTGEVVTAVLG